MIKKEIHLIRDSLDRSTLVSVAMISLLINFLSLSIPIAAQTLINIIAFGKLLQPVVTLSLALLVLMIALGALNIWQIVIVEVIQQKLMVKVSFRLMHQFTHLSLENFSSHHGPELVNRFFEVVTIKKSLASLLLYGLNLGIQLVLGLLLLVFYHPVFILLDAVIIAGLLLAIFMPFRKSLDSAQKECSQKHKLGAWLEEILINRFLFRFNSYHRYATEEADKRLVSFLKARNGHFKQLLKHQIGLYTLSALVVSLLLGLGGYLVIINQLSLGQLVATEIVLGGLVYSFKRFGVLLENYYDLKASQDKIEKVLSLPIEDAKEGDHSLFMPIHKLQISIQDQMTVLATPSMPLLVISTSPDRCQDFTETLLGFRATTHIDFYVNDILCVDLNRVALRHHSLLIGRPQWFAGTIGDNLLLNHRNIPKEIMVEQLKNMGLLDKIMRQPEGLDTIVYEWQTLFTEFEFLQFMVVRAILLQPQLLVIDRAFDFLERNADELLAQLLLLENTILILVSQDPQFKSITNRLVLSS